MKKATIIAVALMMITPAMAFAQGQGQGQGKNTKTPEEMSHNQALRMVDQLLLDESTANKFVPLYEQYKNDTKAINAKYRIPKPNKDQENKAPRSDKEIDKQIRDQFAKSQDILNLRISYYEKFLKVLSPRQIQKMYKIEKDQADNAIIRKHGNPNSAPGPKGNNWSRGNNRPGENQGHPNHNPNPRPNFPEDNSGR